MQENDIPFSQACENNKQPILDVLQSEFASIAHVLEIGSGTGQHAVHFAKHLPQLKWQTADQRDYHEAIHFYLTKYPTENLLAPITLKVPEYKIKQGIYDGFFSANTAHIMQKHEIQFLMAQLNEVLPAQGVFCQYGPFTLNGKFTSKSNEEFHQHLQEIGCGGYRDIDELKAWANQLTLTRIIDMPANNHMLVWRRT